LARRISSEVFAGHQSAVVELSLGTGASSCPAALAVQPHQEVLPRQLRRRDPGQQLPGP